jgi:sugar diacid utilization regulator
MTTKLLEHQLEDYSVICEDLETIGWNVHNSYCCIVCEPIREKIIQNLLFVTAENICSEVSDSRYLFYKDRLVIIKNLSRTSDEKRDEELGLIERRLRTASLRGSVSPVFTDYSELYYYFCCAQTALSISKDNTAEDAVIYYQDYAIKDMLGRYLANSVPEAFRPIGYLFLLEYDEKHGTAFRQTLRCLLENNLNVSRTAQQLFMHRNTIIRNINLLKERFGIDVHDYSTRLRYMLLFAIEDFEVEKETTAKSPTKN